MIHDAIRLAVLPALYRSAVLLGLASPALAQCLPDWLPGTESGSTNGFVNAVQPWDPDGAGPAPLRYVIAGAFTVAGQIAASRIATYDPINKSWATLGSGFDSEVSSLAVLPNGDLVAAGSFTQAGGVPASHVARWDGVSWSPIGLGIGSYVHVLKVLPNGDLVAAGGFSTAGGVAAPGIARWDGSAWSALGGGVQSSFTTTFPGDVFALTLLPNGDLVAGGQFNRAGGVAVANLAQWNGTSWAPLGSGVSNQVMSLTTQPNGDVIAGGFFTSAGGVAATFIARWDGSSWSSLAGGVGFTPYSSVTALGHLANGDLIASGVFSSAGGVPVANIARWNGSTWGPLGPGLDNPARSFAQLPNGSLLVGGTFTYAGGSTQRYLAEWNGSSWSTPGGALTGPVFDLAALPDGSFVVGGSFGAGAGGAAARLARWADGGAGSAWLPLGAGVNGFAVTALAAAANGDVFAAGDFTIAGGTAALHIARWDGAAWHALGSGIAGNLSDLEVMPNGDLIACGFFTAAGGVPAANIARWNGTAWSALGSGLGDVVTSLAVLPDGDLVAGGQFTVAGGQSASCVARWNGSTWSPLGAGTQSRIEALLALPNGDVIAGGSFTFAGGLPAAHIARWNGTTWSPIGGGLPSGNAVRSLAVLPDGDLLAGGDFGVGGGPARLARWNGSTWSLFAPPISTDVRAIATLRDGSVIIGGDAAVPPAGAVSLTFGRVASSCAALANPVGSGCAGSVGVPTLRPVSLPWTGSTFRAAVDNLPGLSLGLAVTSLQPHTIALGLVFPEAGPGCVGLIQPDLTEVLLPVDGSAGTLVALPDQPAFAGLVLHQYVAVFEFDASGNAFALTSTNRLELTIGAW